MAYAASATSTAPAPLCGTKEQLTALNCQNIINPKGGVNTQVRKLFVSFTDIDWLLWYWAACMSELACTLLIMQN